MEPAAAPRSGLTPEEEQFLQNSILTTTLMGQPSLALINGTDYTVGDSIPLGPGGGFRIVRIEQGRVALLGSDGREYFLGARANPVAQYQPPPTTLGQINHLNDKDRAYADKKEIEWRAAEAAEAEQRRKQAEADRMRVEDEKYWRDRKRANDDTWKNRRVYR